MDSVSTTRARGGTAWDEAPRTTGYALIGEARSRQLASFTDALHGALDRAGVEAATEAPVLVLNVVDGADPKPFRRRARGTFVAAVHERTAERAGLEETYPMLVRVLANVVLTFVPGEGVWFTTMERGHYLVRAGDGLAELADRTVERLLPLATARLVIDNEFRPDLEPALWEGDEVTDEIRRTGVRLGRLGLLPSPFPLEELLDEQELRAVKRLYGIGGLSYGNLSQRKDERRFWMSASGVDKSNLERPGRDILLVAGYDAEEGRIVLSVRPDLEPRRVSVDAIEHWTLYQAHPQVGAILHVHAWQQGIHATEINYPCGTEELARAVAELVAAEPDPTHAVVGLRNHGITATGSTLTEILDRIEPTLMRQVPMD